MNGYSGAMPFAESFGIGADGGDRSFGACADDGFGSFSDDFSQDSQGAKDRRHQCPLWADCVQEGINDGVCAAVDVADAEHGTMEHDGVAIF
jgi:hypothetical protein